MIDQSVTNQTLLAWLQAPLLLIVPPIPAERLASESVLKGMTRRMLVDVVAALVLVLMAADVFRMLFIDTEPHRDPVRRNDS
jgi:hypothetical protein